MEPFRGLLKSKETFAWSEELEVAFNTAKSQIVQLVKKRITVFVAGR